MASKRKPDSHADHSPEASPPPAALSQPGPPKTNPAQTKSSQTNPAAKSPVNSPPTTDAKPLAPDASPNPKPVADVQTIAVTKPDSAAEPVPIAKAVAVMKPVELAPVSQHDLHDVVRDVGRYPLEAYEFLRCGLADAVARVHAGADPEASRHVTGQQLALGLRGFAWDLWGYLARTVLARWNITATNDFGRMVYALIAAGQLDKTESDREEDFDAVFDFATLETNYAVAAVAPPPSVTRRPH